MAFEIVEKKYKAALCSLMNFWDFSFITFFNLYWVLVSQDWFYICSFYVVMGIVAWIVFALTIPESPKWLQVQGDTGLAIASLEAISRFNGSENPVEFQNKQYLKSHAV